MNEVTACQLWSKVELIQIAKNGDGGKIAELVDS